MKAETIIKQQARSSLADQNWGVALAAFIFPACVFFMAQTVNSFSIIVRGASVQALTNAPFARPQALLFFLLLQVFPHICGRGKALYRYCAWQAGGAFSAVWMVFRKAPIWQGGGVFPVACGTQCLMGPSLLFPLRLFCCASAHFPCGGKRPFAGRYTASMVSFSCPFDSIRAYAVGSAYLTLLSCTVSVLV